MVQAGSSVHYKSKASNDHNLAMLPVQDDQEPICIDSDDDAQANGAGPAREDSQNGAATRHSERISANQATRTVQRFKVQH